MSFLLDTDTCSAHMRHPAKLAHRLIQSLFGTVAVGRPAEAVGGGPAPRHVAARPTLQLRPVLEPFKAKIRESVVTKSGGIGEHFAIGERISW
jgi:hypothetical protein